MGTQLAFPATKSNRVEIVYIKYINLQYTFDKSKEKIDGRVLVPSPMLRLGINLVPRSLVDEAEGEIWPNPIFALRDHLSGV